MSEQYNASGAPVIHSSAALDESVQLIEEIRDLTKKTRSMSKFLQQLRQDEPSLIPNKAEGH